MNTGVYVESYPLGVGVVDVTAKWRWLGWDEAHLFMSDMLFIMPMITIQK